MWDAVGPTVLLRVGVREDLRETSLTTFWTLGLHCVFSCLFFWVRTSVTGFRRQDSAQHGLNQALHQGLDSVI